MAPQKKTTLYVCSPVSHSEKIVLQQSHFSRMAQATFRILPFLTDTHFPFKQIALFSSLKLHQQDYRIKVTPKTQETTKHPTYTGSLF